MLDDYNNLITILVPKPLVTIKTEDISFLSVFAKEIERLKDKGDIDAQRQLQDHLIEMLMSPEFLENKELSKRICEIGAYYCLPQIVRERVEKLKECISDSSVYLNDLKYCILNSEKIQEQTMVEITLKLL